jgi:broad specificity phosphatase PhoE
MLLPALAHGQGTERAVAPPLVVLVRHAEKAMEPAGDPPLTDAGVARAQALAATLGNAGITAIITTQLLRTRATAEPVASARGLTPEVVPVSGGAMAAHVEAVVAAVRAHAGGVVLVVGHSNSIPAIIEALGGPRLPDICESQYGNLFVLLPVDGDARLIQLRYGTADPEPGPECK